MKYKLALKEKNVKKEDLSKKLQAKIDALDKLVERLNIAPEDENTQEYKDLIEEMDLEITKGVKKFNPEVHKRRLESIANLNTKRETGEVNKGKRGKSVAKVEQIVEEVEQKEQDDDLIDDVKMDVATKSIPKDSLAQSLEELREKAYEAHSLRENQIKVKELEQYSQEPEEIQDFQKAKKPISRSKSLSIGLIGVGLFFVSWGTINLLRSK